jgi:putative FmdB family regulatory protein
MVSNTILTLGDTMPLYDYQCSSCEHAFEKTLKISEMKQPESEICPACGDSHTVQKFTSAAPSLGDPCRLGDTKKLPGDFKDVLKKIHENTPRSNLNLKY